MRERERDEDICMYMFIYIYIQTKAPIGARKCNFPPSQEIMTD